LLSTVLLYDRSDATSVGFHHRVSVERDVDGAVLKCTGAVVVGAAHEYLPQAAFFR
jgi:hypothetical protein